MRRARKWESARQGGGFVVLLKIICPKTGRRVYKGELRLRADYDKIISTLEAYK